MVGFTSASRLHPPVLHIFIFAEKRVHQLILLPNNPAEPRWQKRYERMRIRASRRNMSSPKNEKLTLLLATLSLPPARQLADVARGKSWKIAVLDDGPERPIEGPRTYFGGSDQAARFAAHYDLCLIEPPLDLLAQLPTELLCRPVRFGRLSELRYLEGPIFVKPADPVHKVFDAGVYRAVRDVRGREPIPADTPILAAAPVEWTSEFRCFIREGQIEAWSPYLSFGRPVWKPRCAPATPESLVAFCERLIHAMDRHLPPAFVVDIGVLEDGRWAVVEFNPAWCAAILGADPARVLNVVQRAALWKRTASVDDLWWARIGRLPICP